MNILIADFEIAKYGGIIEHVTAKVRALKSMGHHVDIAQLSVASHGIMIALMFSNNGSYISFPLSLTNPL